MIDPYALGLEVHKISGDEALVLCPYHADSHPSASVNLSKGLFHCFACGQSANVKQLIAVTGGFIKKTDENLLVEAQRGVDEWEHLLSFPLALDNLYLIERKVTDAAVEIFGIRESPDGIIIPMKDKKGAITGAIVRHYVKTPKYKIYGQRPPIWPFSVLETPKDEFPIFIVEGVFGVLNAFRAGVQAVALLGASSLAKAVPYLTGRRFISTLDPDFAGILGMGKLILHGIEALYPTLVADECSVTRWRMAKTAPKTTRRIYCLANEFDNGEQKKDFLRLIDRYKRTIWKAR